MNEKDEHKMVMLLDNECAELRCIINDLDTLKEKIEKIENKLYKVMKKYE